MENVLIGSEGFDLNTVFNTLFTETTASIASSDWAKFARAFGMKEDYIKKQRKNLLLNMEELNDVCLDILTIWKNSNGSSATLGLLVTKLREVEWQDSIDKLKDYAASVERNLHPNPLNLPN